VNERFARPGSEQQFARLAAFALLILRYKRPHEGRRLAVALDAGLGAAEVVSVFCDLATRMTARSRAPKPRPMPSQIIVLPRRSVAARSF